MLCFWIYSKPKIMTIIIGGLAAVVVILRTAGGGLMIIIDIYLSYIVPRVPVMSLPYVLIYSSYSPIFCPVA